MKRLFFALWPDTKTRKALKKITDKMDSLKLKKVMLENLHITLVFIGPVEDFMVSMIEQKVSGISVKPFTVVFDELCYWRKPKILCLGSTSPPGEILSLAKSISFSISDCGFDQDKRPYIPHVTVARKARHKPELDFPPVVWNAQSFCLVESLTKTEGVCYQIIRSWPFNES